MIMDKTENLKSKKLTSNTSQVTLSNVQEQMKGEAEKSWLSNRE